jgi:uncharacterized protein
MSTEAPAETPTAWTRPLPRPTPVSQPFWDGCRDGRLLIQRCQECQGYVFLPQEFCSHCLATALTWVQARGTGRVITYTVVGRPQTPAFEVPYVIAIVQLEEGVDLLTNLTEVDPAGVTIGMPVEVRFVPIGDPAVNDAVLPFFAPAGREAV